MGLKVIISNGGNIGKVFFRRVISSASVGGGTRSIQSQDLHRISCIGRDDDHQSEQTPGQSLGQRLQKDGVIASTINAVLEASLFFLSSLYLAKIFDGFGYGKRQNFPQGHTGSRNRSINKVFLPEKKSPTSSASQLTKTTRR
jgi:hypothetical protein